MSTRSYLICVDSDGCVFDNMELKHKECFCPATINVWNLQNVSRYAREVCDYVNLYSPTRGVNRFPAIVYTLSLLGARPEARARGYRTPDLTALRNFTVQSPSLSPAALRAYICAHGETEDVRNALCWSDEVNENIRRIVRNVAPFPAARSALETLHARARVVIVSQTPAEAIRREWNAQGLLAFADEVYGQEVGGKAECIALARGTAFDSAHTLMIGDAPGDAAAAQKAGTQFYPILPGIEDESWESLPSIAEAFFAGAYAGALADAQKERFDGIFCPTPPWKIMQEDTCDE